ncbi:MAG: SDR family oxidoreductase [Planctomycetes bacterium]|nr:SDR family oxidoreductase [Planctomycetota bacterium]
MRALILGCGYLGSRVANRWLAAGDEVWGLTRSDARGSRLVELGIRPIVGDVTRRETLPALTGFDVVLSSFGFDRASGHSAHDLYVGGLQNVLDRIGAGGNDGSRFIQISSTGVFGEQIDAWVDENTPCSPRRAGGVACLAAERLLATSALADRSIVLRLAGIYGPGRLPRRRELAASEPIAADPSGYLNLIHVDDATDVVVAAERRAPLPGLYVVSDGAPARRAAFYAEIARLLRLPAPRFLEPGRPPPGTERAFGSKRIDNSKLRAELGVRLRYPSYREGLQAIVAEELHSGGIAPSC